MGDTYNRSKYIILSALLSFPTISQDDWRSCMFGEKPQAGDLVSLKSAPPSKFQISWYIKKDRPEGWIEDRHLLQSIEDGELCWWHNVGFSVYTATKYDNWRWTDKQYAFRDRIYKTCVKEGSYIIRANPPVFSEENEVLLSFYERHDFENKWRFEKKFPDWRKVTKAMIAELYHEAVQHNKKETP